jgi:hypothetical protein
VDISGQGRHLTIGGANPQFGHDVLIPYFDATEAVSDHLRRPDEAGLDIIGNEGYIEAASNGITFGAWVYFDTAAPANADMVISKSQNAPLNTVSYALFRRAAAAGGTLRAWIVDGAGVAQETVDSASALVAGQWYFLAAKWTPLGELSCFVYDTKATAVSAIATLRNSGSAFEVMGRDNGAGGAAETTDGKVSLAFLSCMGLHDGAIIALYERSRALFGV